MNTRVSNFIKYLLLLNMLTVAFLFTEINEQSPFELIKMTSLFVAAFTGFCIWVLTRFVREDVEVRWNTALLLQVGILLATVVSFFFSNNKFYSFWGNYNIPTDCLVSFIICLTYSFLLTQFFEHKDDAKKINYVLMLSALGLSLYGIIQHFGYDPISWWGYPQMHLNAYATIGQAVGYATIIGCLMPLMIVSLLHRRHLSHFIIGSVLLFIILMGILYSGSRTPTILGYSSALFVMALFLLKNRTSAVLRRISLIVVLMVISLTAYYLDENNALEQKLQTESLSTGVSERMQVWQGAIEIWKKYPVLGSGPETFAVELKKVNTADFNTNQNWGLYWHKAHNHIIHYLATVGIVGLLAHLALALYVLWRAFYLFRKPEWTEFDWYSMAYLCGYGFINLANLTAFNFVVTQFYVFLFPVVDALFASKNHLWTLRSPRWLNLVNMVMIFALAGALALEYFNFYRADVYFTSSRKQLEAYRNINAAISDIDRAIAAKPNDCRFYLRKASLLAAVFKYQATAGQNFNKAEAYKMVADSTGRALGCEPDNPEAWLYQGKLFMELYDVRIAESLEPAKMSFIQGARFSPINPHYPYHYGMALLKEGNGADFLKQMYATLHLKADYLPAYTQLLNYFYQTQNITEVRRLVNELTKTKLYSPEFLNELGVIINLANSYKDTDSLTPLIQMLERYKKLYPPVQRQ